MNSDLMTVVIPIAISALTTSALLVSRKVIIGILMRWARNTKTELDNIIIETLKGPSILWAVSIGIYMGIMFSELPDKHIVHLSKAVYVVLILSVTTSLANLAGKIFKDYLHRTNLAIPSTGLVHGILKGTIYIVGIIITLSVLGISIAPLVTALGVGGIAVALALQDTLSNLFAGIHVLTEKSVRVGDFVRLEGGHEGYVVDITWRTARVKTLRNSIIIIPNSKLSQSIVTNFHLPETIVGIDIKFGVSYSSDPEHVEQVITQEAIDSIGKVKGLLDNPAPSVVLHPGFGESSLDFTLTVYVREYREQIKVQHELRKRIFGRFKKEGIEIPYPQRVVHLINENPFQKEN